MGGFGHEVFFTPSLTGLMTVAVELDSGVLVFCVLAFLTLPFGVEADVDVGGVLSLALVLLNFPEDFLS